MKSDMIARHSLVIMLAQGASAILGMFALFFISKMWGGYAPGLIGIVWFGLSFVGMFSFITTMGFDNAHVKKISEGRDLGKCNGTYISIKLILTAIMVLCVAGGILVWKHFMGEDIYDATRESVIWLFLGYYVLFSLAQIPIMTFNSLKKNAISQLTILMEPLTRALLFLVIGLAGIAGAEVVTETGILTFYLDAPFEWPSFLGGMQDFIATHVVGSLAVAYLLGGLAMFAAGFLFLRKYPVSKPDKEYMSMYLKFAVPLMVPIIFVLITSSLDKVLLGYYWTSVDVGYYFSVQRIVTLIIMVPSAIGIVLYPTISAKHAAMKRRRGCSGELCRLIKTAARFMSMVTVPLVCVFVVFSIPIIDAVLNSSFRPGATSMQILAVYTYLATLVIPYYYLVLGTNRPALIAKVYTASSIINIILNFLLIPRNGLLSGLDIMGPTGAATATLLSSFILFAGTYHYSRKVAGRPLLEGRILKHLAAGVVAGAFIWWLGEMVDPIRWYHLVTLSITCLGAYLGALRAMGEFGRPEIRFFTETISPMKLLRYVKSELTGRKGERTE